MAKSYVVPADGIDNTPIVRVAGQFHFMVDLADENPTKKDTGEQIDKLRVDCTCLGGAPANQAKHKFTLWLRNPNESHKDQGAFCAKIQLRLADALGLLKSHEAGQEVEVDWTKAKGRQFVAFLTLQKGTDQVERLDLDGANIYHVDDASVSHVPKNMQALGLLPPGLRRLGADPNNARTQTANGGAAKQQQKAPPKQQQQLAGAGAGANGGGAVDLDSL